MWLKYIPVFKHGYGTPGYAELNHRHLTGERPEDWMNDLKEEIKNEFGDPEGYREPIWEIVEIPPKEVLQQMVQHQEELVAYHTAKLVRLRNLIKETYHD